VALVRERTIPTERLPLVEEVSANVCRWGCHVVSVTDPYGIIIPLKAGNKINMFERLHM
jgi:hypothetical protein